MSKKYPGLRTITHRFELFVLEMHVAARRPEQRDRKVLRAVSGFRFRGVCAMLQLRRG